MSNCKHLKMDLSFSGFDKEYNPECITMLKTNFRSHEKLIQLPSRLFYHSELVARGDPMITGYIFVLSFD